MSISQILHDKFMEGLVVDTDGNVLFNQIDIIHQTVHQGYMHTLSLTYTSERNFRGEQ